MATARREQFTKASVAIWPRGGIRFTKAGQETNTNQEDEMKDDITKTIADAEAEEARAKLAKVDGGAMPLTGAADPISSEARAAIGRAMAALRPYASDARIAGLISKLAAIAGTATKSETLASELQKVDSAVAAVTKADGPMPPDARAQNARATREAEIAYLREVGGNVDAWSRGRAAYMQLRTTRRPVTPLPRACARSGKASLPSPFRACHGPRWQRRPASSIPGSRTRVGLVRFFSLSAGPVSATTEREAS